MTTSEEAQGKSPFQANSNRFDDQDSRHSAGIGVRSSVGFDAVALRRACRPRSMHHQNGTKGFINYCASRQEPGAETPVNPQISDRITNRHGASMSGVLMMAIFKTLASVRAGGWARYTHQQRTDRRPAGAIIRTHQQRTDRRLAGARAGHRPAGCSSA